jgi:hypothetical protein
MNRREFLERSALAASGALLGRQTAAAQPQRMIGIQVGPVSFLDEGTGKVLDTIRDLGAADTVFLATFTYGTGISGRTPKSMPLPDHGKQEYDNHHGGIFFTPHAQYYRRTAIAPEKAPDYPNYDVIADVLPAAHARGMKVIGWFEDVFRADTPGVREAYEIDVHGQPAARVCYRNPNTRNFWLGLVEDQLRTYDLDGLMFGCERQGPLNSAIGASHGGDPSPGTVGCFCPHCLDAAKRETINATRAREGYLQLEKWVNGLKSNARPVDGAFVTFWRILVDYPEVLAWERLWTEGLRETYQAMYAKAHEIASAKPIGWHIWHTNSFAPFYRAEQDYQKFQVYSDFLKVVMYNNSGGPRMARYISNVDRTVFADLTPELTQQLTYAILQYGNEPAVADLKTAGLTSDYVARETRRAVASAGPKMKIWPGIDIDVPTASNEKRTQPDDVYNAVRAALDAGAQGVILSRKYSEMRLDNLRAAGRAVRGSAEP